LPTRDTPAADFRPAELRQRYREACDRSRQVVSDATSLDQQSVQPLRDGTRFSLRWVLLHLIEESARHAGHADFLREAIDGAVGEETRSRARRPIEDRPVTDRSPILVPERPGEHREDRKGDALPQRPPGIMVSR
jgi:Protein of unknown function (DUF664)